MNKFKDMQFFCAVVEKGNFAKAARALTVTPAIVGRRISNLETELGFTLFNRTTRQIQLTPAGQDYYEGCKQILLNLSELEDSLKTNNQVNPNGVIRISAPDGLGDQILIEIIKQFKELYPNIHFVVHFDNQPTGLVENEIDITFRLSFDLQDSSYIVTKLIDTTFGLYASEKYLALNGKPTSVNDLRNHKCIHMGANRYGDSWTVLENGKVVTFKHDWDLIVSNTSSLLKSLSADLGIALVPKLFIEGPLEQNNLVEITDVASFPELGLYALYPTKKHLPYRNRLFLDFVKSWFSEPSNLSVKSVE